jgi:putative thioredoxin
MPNSEHIYDVSEVTFGKDVLAHSHQTPVVVDFWAPWCGPCRMLGPVLEKLAAEGAGAFRLAKVNVDDNPRLAAEYGVRGIPAVKAFRNGQVAAEFTGALPEPRVREFLRKLVPAPFEKELGEAAGLLTARHWAEAETCFRGVFEKQPQNGAAALGLVKTLLAQGRGCEASAVLEDFPRTDEVLTVEKLRPLAEWLCAVEPAEPPLEDSDLDAAYFQAARLFARGQWEAALDGVLDVLRQDKRYRKGEPRLVILAIFELLGEGDPLTSAYRSELASVLF